MFRQIVPIFILMILIVFALGVPLLAQESSLPDSPRQIIVRVDGASCPFCAFGLEKRLGQIEGVNDVKLEMKEGKAIVTLEEGAVISEETLRQAVDDAGFTPREIIYPE